MRIKILGLIVVFILMSGIVGCINPRKEQQFPTAFTRISDGFQISLGMSRDEIERVMGDMSVTDFTAFHFPERLGIYEEDNMLMMISYSPSEKVTSIQISVPEEGILLDWTVDGMAIGDNIQSIFDSSRFISFFYNRDRGVIIINNENETPTYHLEFWYNDEEIITFIRLMYLPDLRTYDW